VQWDPVGEDSPGVAPAQPQHDARHEAAVAAPSEPEGFVYDAEGNAYPVFAGHVYDAEGNAHPLASLAGIVHPGPAPAAHAEEHFDRFAEVDPGVQWGFGEGEEHASRSARRERRSGGRGRSAAALLVSLALVGVGAFAVWKLVGPIFDNAPAVTAGPQDFPGPGSGAVEVVVSPGDTGAAIGRTLAEAGVVASVEAFTRAYAANPDAVGIQHGTYAMLLEMNAAEAVERLLDRANRVELRVTIPEGYTVEQILRVASARTQIPIEEFEAAAEDPRGLGVPKGNKKQLEGWLFPATYTVEPGDTAEDILGAMVAKTIKELTRLDVPDDDWQDVLIKASLVEREVNRDADRGKAARAIENRLDKGMTLGIDATLAYGLGKSGLELTKSDLESDHPYNTRTQVGLPPTPIGSPGLASIEAVLDPPEGAWEYWVTVNLLSGETLFAETYAEHLENVALLDKWIEENGMPDSSRPGDAEE